jgi:hypothetical protein
MSWTNVSKIATTFTNLLKRARSFLLKEDSGYLLLENGDKIILDRGAEFANQQKSV